MFVVHHDSFRFLTFDQQTTCQRCLHAQILGVPGARATLLVTELYLWARLPSAILAQATRGLSKVVAPKDLSLS